jgi:hypothetical protein
VESCVLVQVRAVTLKIRILVFRAVSTIGVEQSGELVFYNFDFRIQSNRRTSSLSWRYTGLVVSREQ